MSHDDAIFGFSSPHMTHSSGGRKEHKNSGNFNPKNTWELPIYNHKNIDRSSHRAYREYRYNVVKIYLVLRAF